MSTRLQVPVTRHRAPGSRLHHHQAVYFIRHQAVDFTGHQAPGTGLQAPGTSHPAPVTGQRLMRTDHQAPVSVTGHQDQASGTGHQSSGTRHQCQAQGTGKRVLGNFLALNKLKTLRFRATNRQRLLLRQSQTLILYLTQVLQSSHQGILRILTDLLENAPEKRSL